MRFRRKVLPGFTLAIVGLLAVVLLSRWRAAAPLSESESSSYIKTIDLELELNATPVTRLDPVDEPDLLQTIADDVVVPAMSSLEDDGSRPDSPSPYAYLKEQRMEPWASQTEARIYEALAAIPGGASLIEVDCRSRFCRVEVVTELTCALGLSKKEYSDEDMRIQGEFEDAFARILQKVGYGAVHTCDGNPGIFATFDRERLAGNTNYFYQDRE
jgi:hypothetical protein